MRHGSAAFGSSNAHLSSEGAGVSVFAESAAETARGRTLRRVEFAAAGKTGGWAGSAGAEVTGCMMYVFGPMRTALLGDISSSVLRRAAWWVRFDHVSTLLFQEGAPSEEPDTISLFERFNSSAAAAWSSSVDCLPPSRRATSFSA